MTYPADGNQFDNLLMPDGTVVLSTQAASLGGKLWNAANAAAVAIVNQYGQTEAQWQAAVTQAYAASTNGTIGPEAPVPTLAVAADIPAPSAIVAVPGGSATVPVTTTNQFPTPTVPVSHPAAQSIGPNSGSEFQQGGPYQNINPTLTISPGNVVPVGTMLYLTIEGLNPSDRVEYSTIGPADSDPQELGSADQNGVFQFSAPATTPESFTNYIFINGIYFTDYSITIVSAGQQSSAVQPAIVSPATVTTPVSDLTDQVATPATSIFSSSTIISGVPDVLTYGAIAFAAFKMFGRRAS